jgi:pimeloyl-ACP methyl ester carboxylesterase
MPLAERPDGVEIHWQESGAGPLVAIACYWAMHPTVFENLIRELERDHRVVLYHDRGTGHSTRSGPYDLDTAAGDLASVIEAAGRPAVVISTADGINRAVRVLARRPELITGIVGIGGVPIGRAALADSDALAGSKVVVDALARQVETDYRGALRGLLTATNPQMSEDELRERVTTQIEHCPQHVATARMHAWIEDDPSELARAAGDRLWLGVSENLGGGWFPAGDEMRRRIAEALPDARVVEVDDGFVSRPDQTARIVREVVAGDRALQRAE